MAPETDNIRVVLFDLGGVLVELSGIPLLIEWMGGQISREQLIEMWLTSPAVRAFETGQITVDEFGDELIAELALPVKRKLLLEEFAKWPRRLFPGVLELLGRIPRRYLRVTLSNTNALHWPRLMKEMGLGAAFDHHFASHLTGKIKPDEDVFYHVTNKLGCRPEEVLFLDDNRMNVEVANRIGMRAVEVQGPAAAEQALMECGVLERQ